MPPKHTFGKFKDLVKYKISQRFFMFFFKVESFIREHTDLGTATREFQNAVTKIKFNIGWMEKHYENLQRWLKGQTSQAL